MPPAAAFGTGSLAVSEELRGAWRRLAHALRSALHAAVALDAAPSTLEALAERAAGLAGELERHATGRALPSYRVGPGAQLSDLLPFSPVGGDLNPLAPSLALALDGERVCGRVRFGRAFEGGPGNVHGGALSAVFDELLAMAAIARGLAGPTARLAVDFRRPAPIEVELELEARVERVHRRKVVVRGACRHDGAVLAEAEAVFVKLASSPPPFESGQG